MGEEGRTPNVENREVFERASHLSRHDQQRSIAVVKVLVASRDTNCDLITWNSGSGLDLSLFTSRDRRVGTAHLILLEFVYNQLGNILEEFSHDRRPTALQRLRQAESGAGSLLWLL